MAYLAAKAKQQNNNSTMSRFSADMISLLDLRGAMEDCAGDCSCYVVLAAGSATGGYGWHPVEGCRVTDDATTMIMVMQAPITI